MRQGSSSVVVGRGRGEDEVRRCFGIRVHGHIRLLHIAAVDLGI